jgi:hypothetical protein
MRALLIDDAAAYGGQRWSAIFRTYFDSAADCLFHVGPTTDGRLVYESINPAGLAHVGLTLDAVRGRTSRGGTRPRRWWRDHVGVTSSG